MWNWKIFFLKSIENSSGSTQKIVLFSNLKEKLFFKNSKIFPALTTVYYIISLYFTTSLSLKPTKLFVRFIWNETANENAKKLKFFFRKSKFGIVSTIFQEIVDK